MEDPLQKLIAEYRAIQKIDRIVQSVDQRNDAELIGLKVRELRRREILLELINWLIAAEDLLKPLQTQEDALSGRPFEG